MLKRYLNEDNYDRLDNYLRNVYNFNSAFKKICSKFDIVLSGHSTNTIDRLYEYITGKSMVFIPFIQTAPLYLFDKNVWFKNIVFKELERNKLYIIIEGGGQNIKDFDIEAGSIVYKDNKIHLKMFDEHEVVTLNAPVENKQEDING